MFSPADVVVVAVSGGKDSLALWHALARLGYTTHGLYIDLGISHHGYSAVSREKALAFSRQHRLPLTVVSLADEAGFTIDDHRRLGARTACSTCGLVKRYHMNRFALELNATAIATGHNLDDETGVLLSNLLSWQTGYLARQAPVLEERAAGFARKVKPLCEITERETAAYAFLAGIDYVVDECPYSVGATSLFYKGLINQLEHRSPGSKLRFYRGFLENRRAVLATPEQSIDTRCSRCGQPSTVDPCAYCRLLERAHSQTPSGASAQ